jgi:Domain of unknown function (DUF4328)
VAESVGEPRPLNRLGQLAIALLGVVLVANLVALWADVIQLNLVTDIRDGKRVDLAELTDSDERVSAAQLFQFGTYVACMVGFLVWYGRAYRNLERLGALGPRWGKRWAIAYWFIPIGNLFRPKQVMNDIWRASDPELPDPAHHWHGNRVPALFHWWWALWLLSSFISNIIFRRTLDTGDTADELVSAASGYVVWDVVDIIPAILLMIIIHRTTKRQETRRARVTSAPPPQPLEAPVMAGAPPAPPDRPSAPVDASA